MAYLTIPARHTEFFGSGLLNSGGYGCTAASVEPPDPLNEAYSTQSTFIKKSDWSYKNIQLTSYVLNTYWNYIVANYYLRVSNVDVTTYWYDSGYDPSTGNYYTRYACIDKGYGKVKMWRYPVKLRLTYTDGVIETVNIPATSDFPTVVTNEVWTKETNIFRGYDASEPEDLFEVIYPDELFFTIPIRTNQQGNNISFSYIAYIEL